MAFSIDQLGVVPPDHAMIRSMTYPSCMLPFVHWFMAAITSSSVTSAHGGLFPGIMHGPSVVVVVDEFVVEDVVEEVDVDEVVDDVVVDVVVVLLQWHSITSTSTPHRL